MVIFSPETKKKKNHFWNIKFSLQKIITILFFYRFLTALVLEVWLYVMNVFIVVVLHAYFGNYLNWLGKP